MMLQTCISTRMPMMLMEVASMAVRIFMMVMMMEYHLISLMTCFQLGVLASAESDGGYEFALAFTGIDNLTVKAIMAD